MKISEIIDLLTKATLVKEYFEDFLNPPPGAPFDCAVKCTMPKPRVEEAAKVIGELIEFIENRDI